MREPLIMPMHLEGNSMFIGTGFQAGILTRMPDSIHTATSKGIVYTRTELRIDNFTVPVFVQEDCTGEDAVRALFEAYRIV